NFIGNLLQIGQQRLEQLLRQCSSFLRYKQADHVKDGELSGECLGARYADFRPRVCVGTSMRCPRDGRAHDVTYADDGSAPLLGELDSSQGIGRLTGLGYRNNDVTFVDNRIAIPEFGSILHFHRDPAEFLEQIFSYQSGVPRRTAGDDNDALGVGHRLDIIANAAQYQMSRTGVKPSPHAVANRSRLFENLLQHEVVVATLFDGFEREFQRMNVWGHRNVLDRLDRQAIGIDNRNFTVVEIHHLVRVFDNWRSVGGQEVFILADADDQRAAFSGGDELVRVVEGEHDDRVGADNVVKGETDRLNQ